MEFVDKKPKQKFRTADRLEAEISMIQQITRWR